MAWRAWQELSTERQHVIGGYAAPMGGMVLSARPCPIHWSVIVTWCDRAGVDDDERTEFVQPLVAALDREYIAHWELQQTKQKFEPPDDKLSRWERMDGDDSDSA